MLFIQYSYSQSQVEMDLCKTKKDNRFESEYYVLTHTMPQFKKGNKKLDKFLKKQYKKEGLLQNGGNKTYASFIVDIGGELKNVKLLKEPEDKSIQEKIIRIVNRMPNWKAGKCDNIKVPVLYNLPLKY